MKEELKEGGWCFCEFELQMIKKIENDGIVTEVTDGFIEHSGTYLICFPLTFEIIWISQQFSRCWYMAMKTRHPETAKIHARLVEWWIKSCKSDEVESTKYINLAKDLVQRIQKAIEIER